MKIAENIIKYEIEETAICSAQDVVDLLFPKITDTAQEHFYVLYLNHKNIPHVKLVGLGGSNSAVIHPADIFRTAIRLGLPNLLLCHNHPSGNPEPSKEDILFTKTVKEGAKLLGLTVLDHVILGNEKYYSFKTEGLI